MRESFGAGGAFWGDFLEEVPGCNGDFEKIFSRLVGMKKVAIPLIYVQKSPGFFQKKTMVPGGYKNKKSVDNDPDLRVSATYQAVYPKGLRGFVITVTNPVS